MKQGKKPISQKAEPLTTSAIFGGNAMELPEIILDHLTQKGLGYKFISIRHLKSNGGKHKRGWTPYKLPEELKQALPENPYHTAQGDYYEVGDLVLGVKKLTGSGVSIENHRRFLKEETQLATKEAFTVPGVGEIRVED